MFFPVLGNSIYCFYAENHLCKMNDHFSVQFHDITGLTFLLPNEHLKLEMKCLVVSVNLMDNIPACNAGLLKYASNHVWQANA